MASNSDLALIGATGVGYMASTSAAAPTDFSALDSNVWSDLGYISDAGLVSNVTEARKDFTPWGKITPIRTQLTQHFKTFQVVCWESNEAVLGLYYRKTLTDVTPTPSTNIISFDDNDAPSNDRRSFVFDILDGSNKFRFYIPEGEVTARAGQVYKTDEIIGYDMTISAYPNGSGVSVHRFFEIAALS